MRSSIISLGVCTLLSLTAGSAVLGADDDDQLPSCGGMTTGSFAFQLSQNDHPIRAATAVASTAAEPTNPCLYQTKSVAFWTGFDALGSSWALTSTEIALTRSMPGWSTYYGGGYHYYRYYVFPWVEWQRPTTHFSIEMVQGDEPCDFDDPWGELMPNCPDGSPILVDMSGDGFQLAGLEEGVNFDLDGDGYLDHVSWTRANSDDALLALDRNHNGLIDSGLELFGNHTQVLLPGGTFTTPHGFAALQFFELPTPGVPNYANNNLINTDDPGFNDLLLWVDSNHNGISEPNELRNARDSGLESIDAFNVHESRRQDQFGNLFKFFSDSVWRKAGRTMSRRLVDVWFVTD